MTFNTSMQPGEDDSVLRRSVQRFQFSRVSQSGMIERGVVSAIDQTQARYLISKDQSFVLEIELLAKSSSRMLSFGRGPSTAEVSTGLRSLSTLLSADLPAGKALRMLQPMLAPRMGAHLADIVRSVEEGSSLARAISDSEWHLSPHLLGLIRAGEESGQLATGVRQAADAAEQSARSRAVLLGALTYPCILLLVGIASCGVLVTIVLPRFAELFSDMGAELPASTKLLLRITRIDAWVWFSALIGLAIAVWIFVHWIQQPENRRIVHAFLLRIPVIGSLRNSIASGRICLAIGGLVESGVTLPAALNASASAVGDLAIGARIRIARKQVLEGGTLSESLAETKSLTVLALNLIRAGEESGKLAPMLQHAGRIESDRAEQFLKSAVRVVEPSLILGFGGIVAFVAASILQAVYGMRVSG